MLHRQPAGQPRTTQARVVLWSFVAVALGAMGVLALVVNVPPWSMFLVVAPTAGLAGYVVSTIVHRLDARWLAARASGAAP